MIIKIKSWISSFFTESSNEHIASRDVKEVFKRFFENSPIPQAIMSIDGIYLDVNNVFCKLHGFERHELIGDTPSHAGISTEEEFKKIMEILRQSNNRLEGHLVKYPKRDGTILYAKIYAHRINDDHALLVALHDVTEQRKTTRALKESERFLNVVLNSIPTRVFWKNKDLVFIGANQHAAADVGFSSPSDLIGKTDYDLLDKNSADMYVEDDRQVMAQDTGKLFFEEKQVFKDGTTRWVLTSKVPLKDESGKIIGILGTYDDITPRKQAEFDLRLARFSINIATSSVIWVSREGRILDFNPAFSNMLQYSRDELLNMTIPDIDPTLTPEGWEIIWKNLQQKKISQFFAQNVRKDGKVLDIEVRAHYINLDGHEYHCAIVNDVTERKQTEAKLHQTNKFLETLLNHIPSGVFWKDRESKYLGANAMFRAVANYYQDIVGKTDSDFPWAEQLQELQADDRYVMENNSPKLFYVEQLRNADGQMHYNEVSKVPLVDDNGEVFGVLGIFRDITEQKKIEIALNENEKLLKGVVQNASAIIYMIDTEGIIRLSEGLGLAVLGLSPGQVIGQSAFDMYKDHPDVIDTIRKGLNGETVDNEVSLNGITFSNRFTPVRDERGLVTGILCVSFDITSRKKMEEDLNLLNAELEHRVATRTGQLQQANQDLEAFAYSVSHDLRAPIRHIDGFSKLMYNAISNPSETITRHYNRIIESSQRMAQMVDDLLTFARLGKKPITKTSVDLDSIIGKTINHLKIDIANRDIEWNVKPLGIIQGDSNLLQLAFENILLNSIKYSSPQPRTVIEVGCSRTNGEIQIYFKDNGVGFDMAYANKLFGVFQRLHSHEEFEGTGIGLANVRQIVLKHNGSIKAKGKVGEGATFYLTFPLT